MKVRKKALSLLLAAVMVLGTVPFTSVVANAEDTGVKKIELKTSGVADKDFVYFGNYNNENIKWKVLDADADNTGAENGMFLLSEYLLEQKNKPFDNDSNVWQGSDAQDWCTAFADSSTLFTGSEKSALKGVSKTDAATTQYNTDWGTSYLADEKVFYLSAEEAATYIGPNYNDPGLATTTSNGAYGGWWLRSHKYGDTHYAIYVTENAEVKPASVNFDYPGVRPAFNLNLNSVLFSSATVGGKSSGIVGEYALTSVSEYTGTTKDWKLTLLDESRNNFNAELSDGSRNATVSRGQSVYLNYSHARYGNNEFVSAIIVNSQNQIVKYGHIANNSSNANNAAITIPNDLEVGQYTLSVFSEQINGNAESDYASPLCSIPLQVGFEAPDLTPIVTTRTSNDGAVIKFNSTKDGTYYYSVVDQGQAEPSIDTSNEGYQLNEGENTLNLSGLETDDKKDVYIIAKNVTGNLGKQIKTSFAGYEDDSLTVITDSIRVFPTNSVYLLDDKEYTIEGTTSQCRIVADPGDGKTCTVILKGTSVLSKICAFEIKSGNVIVKIESGTNTFDSGDCYAGIQQDSDNTSLTIENAENAAEDAILICDGGHSGGCGIGGGYEISESADGSIYIGGSNGIGSNIVINSGNIKASGYGGSAAIGGCSAKGAKFGCPDFTNNYLGGNANITINGGCVTTTNNNGFGIGGGKSHIIVSIGSTTQKESDQYGSATIKINGGIITCCGDGADMSPYKDNGVSHYDIGGGYAQSKEIIVAGTSGYDIFNSDINYQKGEIYGRIFNLKSVAKSDLKIKYNDLYYHPEPNQDCHILKKSGNYEISGTTTKEQIVIDCDCTLTLNGVTIDFSGQSKNESGCPIKSISGNSTIVLASNTKNKMIASGGAHVNGFTAVDCQGGTLAISGDGSLYAEGGCGGDNYDDTFIGLPGGDGIKVTEINSGTITGQGGAGYFFNKFEVPGRGGNGVDVVTIKGGSINGYGGNSDYSTIEGNVFGTGILLRDQVKLNEGDRINARKGDNDQFLTSETDSDTATAALKDNQVLLMSLEIVNGDFQKTYNVDITWGDMNFTYDGETWNADTYKWENGSWTCGEDSNKLTVTNNSNVPVTAGLSYEKIDSAFDVGFNDSNSTVLNSLSLQEADTKSAYIVLTGVPVADMDNKSIGTVTVVIS